MAMSQNIIRTCALLVTDKHFHHCAIPAPLYVACKWFFYFFFNPTKNSTYTWQWARILLEPVPCW